MATGPARLVVSLLTLFAFLLKCHEANRLHGIIYPFFITTAVLPPLGDGSHNIIYEIRGVDTYLVAKGHAVAFWVGSARQAHAHFLSYHHSISMQGPPTPTENDEASIPAEHLLTVPHLDAGSRKAAMRNFAWKLTSEELQLELSQPLQDDDEDIRDTKRPRLEEPFRTSTDEATTENTSHATTSALLLPDADDTADLDHVMDMHPNTGTTTETEALRRWTLDEDAQLNNAVTNTRKKKWGKELRVDWVAVAELVPGRTQKQCRNRWYNRSVSNDGTCWQMDSRRGQEVEGFGTRVRWQELGESRRLGHRSNESSVSQQMA
jgi:hypothetical protein